MHAYADRHDLVASNQFETGFAVKNADGAMIALGAGCQVEAIVDLNDAPGDEFDRERLKRHRELQNSNLLNHCSTLLKPSSEPLATPSLTSHFKNLQSFQRPNHGGRIVEPYSIARREIRDFSG
jgi:hypothetical protein